MAAENKTRKTPDLNTRRAGILLHPTSFPSPFGIGDLGEEARTILRKFADAKVSLWQILPLGPTGFGDSPYSARSTFAGNELLIDLRSLDSFFGKKGMGKTFTDPEDRTTGRVDYPSVYADKMVKLKEAASLFASSRCTKAAYKAFCSENAWWLDDYALYQALVNYNNDSRWYLWEEDLKRRKAEALEKWTRKLSKEIEIYKILQYFFFSQWNDLHGYANSLGIQIIGDIPIYVAGDSVDAWTNWSLFKIDEDGNQTALAGCPPDEFTELGQLWGNPVYNWPVHRKTGYAWWKKRMEMTLKLVDIVRIDHFRGFESYWEVPQGSKDARNGKWVKGPGMDLLENFRGMSVIGEDLGFITPEVEAMKNASGFPGMKVLQFAWGISDGKLDTSNESLPHNFETANCIAYTGTHDNATTRGWYNSQDECTKDWVRRYLQCPDEDVTWQMIRAAMASIANTAIIPLQDIMDLDNSHRMNVPSTVGSSNWSWRFDPAMLQDWQLSRFREFVEVYGRAVE